MSAQQPSVLPWYVSILFLPCPLTFCGPRFFFKAFFAGRSLVIQDPCPNHFHLLLFGMMQMFSFCCSVGIDNIGKLNMDRTTMSVKVMSYKTCFWLLHHLPFCANWRYYVQQLVYLSLLMWLKHWLRQWTLNIWLPLHIQIYILLFNICAFLWNIPPIHSMVVSKVYGC